MKNIFEPREIRRDKTTTVEKSTEQKELILISCPHHISKTMKILNFLGILSIGTAISVAAIQSPVLSSLLGDNENSQVEHAKNVKTSVARLSHGMMVGLQADTGQWFARCRGCQSAVHTGSQPNDDTVAVHVGSRPSSNIPYAQFQIVHVGGGKIALKSDTGKYVARCNNCVEGGAYSDFLTIHVTDPYVPYAQFTPVRLPNGKYALRADTGKYIGRCNNCSPTSVYADTVAVHVSDPTDAPYAQWKIVSAR